MTEKIILNKLYQDATKAKSLQLDANVKKYLDVISDHRESNKGVLAILITLTLKKIIDPKQDIRNHQVQINNGFSARTLDTNVVTPFLKENEFPYMVSGSGALTRSLEQARPYNLDYPGKIRPPIVKDAFLKCVDIVETQRVDMKAILIYLFQKLIFYRNRDRNLLLTKPSRLSIKDIVLKLHKHFDESQDARLPVLAVYSVYQQLTLEIKKYKECKLCELQPHTSPDKQSGFLGDIQVNDPEGYPFEVVEVKHNIELSSAIVAGCYNKLKKTEVKTYYLLSTNENLKDSVKIGSLLMDIYKNHGCQMIVNGIQTTLRYYLRLLSNTDKFIYSYVKLLEKESDYNTKMKWEELW